MGGVEARASAAWDEYFKICDRQNLTYREAFLDGWRGGENAPQLTWTTERPTPGEDLLPCPHCGGEAGTPTNWGDPSRPIPRCKGCGAEAPSPAAWNRRAGPILEPAEPPPDTFA